MKRLIAMFNRFIRLSLSPHLRRRWIGLPVDQVPSTPDYCRRFGLQCLTVDPERPILKDAPVHWDLDLTDAFDFQDREHPTHPPTFVTTLPGGSSIGHNGYIVTADDLLLGDLSRHYNSGPFREHRIFDKSLMATPRRRLKGRAAVLAGEGADIYYHWLIDLMPRIDLLCRAGFDLSGFDHFIVTGDRIEAAGEWLRIAGIPPDRIVKTEPFVKIEADELVVPSYPHTRLQPCPEAVRYLASSLGPRFAAGRTPPDRPCSRIFIERKGRRRLQNQAAVKVCLQNFGFSAVQLETLCPAEQVRHFAQAEIVIGAHGSGLANAAFCRPGTTLIEIGSTAYFTPCFRQVAVAAGLNYITLVNLPDSGKPRQPGLHDNKARPSPAIEALEAGLSALLGPP